MSNLTILRAESAAVAVVSSIVILSIVDAIWHTSPVWLIIALSLIVFIFILNAVLSFLEDASPKYKKLTHKT